MQQLSSRDCDKWLSMTLTMKEKSYSAGRGEREKGGKSVGSGRPGQQLEGFATSMASRVYWLKERHFKTQSTFLVSFSRIEAKGSHTSLSPLEILLLSLFLWLFQQETRILRSCLFSVSFSQLQ